MMEQNEKVLFKLKHYVINQKGTQARWIKVVIFISQFESVKSLPNLTDEAEEIQIHFNVSSGLS